MNLIMKKTAVTKDFLIMPVFMTKKKKKSVAMEILVSKLQLKKLY